MPFMLIFHKTELDYWILCKEINIQFVVLKACDHRYKLKPLDSKLEARLFLADTKQHQQQQQA